MAGAGQVGQLFGAGGVGLWFNLKIMSSSPLVVINNLTKVYGRKDTAVLALDKVSLTVEPGELLAVMGPSGSGKTSLLHCAAGLDRPSGGSVHLLGTDVGSLSDNRLSRFRRRNLGFIFQAYNLIPTLTAFDNIRLARQIARLPAGDEEINQLAAQMGIADRLKHRPGEMSGGQQQRVAVMRALVCQPKIIFADEPTGNLDSKTSDNLVDFLAAQTKERSLAIIVVTHDVRVASKASRVVFLRDGRLAGQLDQPSQGRIFEELGRLEAAVAA